MCYFLVAMTRPTCNSSCVNQTWNSATNRLAQWLFDGNYRDQINNYNTTPYNPMLFTTNGYVNQAIIFNGSNTSTLVAPYLPLSNSSFTIDMWLYITNLRMDKNNYALFGICSQYLAFRCLHLIFRQVSGTFALSLDLFSSACRGVTALTVNTWTHAAFVFDLVTLTQRIYLNGILDNNCQTTSVVILTTTTQTTIGHIPLIAWPSDYSPYEVSTIFFSFPSKNNSIKTSRGILIN